MRRVKKTAGPGAAQAAPRLLAPICGALLALAALVGIVCLVGGAFGPAQGKAADIASLVLLGVVIASGYLLTLE